MKRWSLAIVSLFIGLVLGSALVGRWLYGQGAPPGPVATKVPIDAGSYRELIKKVLPAVVSIDAQPKGGQKAKGKPRPPGDFDFPMPDFSPKGFGSGFFVAPSGVVLTNLHVVDGAEQAIVTLSDGRKFTSKDIRGDRRTDLAIIRLDLKDPVPYLELGDSDALEMGDRVLAFGAPFGLTGSATQGIISGKGRNLNMNMYEDFVQTDAAINPGNSGGPLVSLDGKAIGINAAIKSKSGGFQGVGLAVASNLARDVVKALEKDGVVRRGYLGVQVRDLDPEVRQRLKLPKDAGVSIGDVFDNTPAAKAGLKAGDILTHVAGKPVKDGRMVQNVVAGLPLGAEVEVTIVRNGERNTVAVTIEEQPQDLGGTRVPAPLPPREGPSGVMQLDKLGMAIGDLTPTMADDLGYRAGTSGPVVTDVDPNSLAAKAGLKPGMLLTKVENQKVASAAEATPILEKANLTRGVLLQVQSPRGGTTFVLLRSDGAGE